MSFWSKFRRGGMPYFYFFYYEGHFINGAPNGHICGMHFENCNFRRHNFGKLLVAELKINVDCGTLKVDVGTRKFWSTELFYLTYC